VLMRARVGVATAFLDTVGGRLLRLL